MPSTPRSILHVDMDAFFASVEQLDDPALRGKPVLVGHDGPRGVVAAASYEARVFGCRSAQPMAIAKRRCPQAIVVPGRGRRYREVSERVFAIFHDVTPLVEPLSIDEAFLDVGGSVPLLGAPATIAASIKTRIRGETGLTASVGVAPNKFLAKLVSDWDKPDGLTIVGFEDVATRVAARAIGEMWGVGPALEAKLRARGVSTFGDLQRLSRDEVVSRFGAHAEMFWRLARGQDERRVRPDSRARSIGHEQTFSADLTVPDAVREVLLGQTERVGARLRAHELAGRRVTVKIRYGDFETITRSTTFERATDCTDELWSAARRLFDRWAAASFRPVRLVGVSVGHLEAEGGRQLDLFVDDDDARHHRIDEATDAIESRFGRGSIRRGVPHREPAP